MSEQQPNAETNPQQEPTSEEASTPAAEEEAHVAVDTPESTGEIDPVAAERDAYRDTLQRLQADFENYRKRMQKQQLESAERANESLVQKLLSVLDTLDLAKAHESNPVIDQVSGSLGDLLWKEGLERIPAVDQPFDPTLHEAVAHEPGEGEPTVAEELRAGYRWKGRVIRPAMVKVVG